MKALILPSAPRAVLGFGALTATSLYSNSRNCAQPATKFPSGASSFNSFNRFNRFNFLGCSFAALWLLAAVSAKGQTPYTATGWVNQVLAPPIICINNLGQVLFRATAFTVRIDSSDPRLTGKRTVFSDGYLQADGSTVVYGTAYHEVGTWAGTNFTPTGGLWELQWRGVMQTNYSMQHSVAGYGSGGTIDGLRLEETGPRTNAASPFDPTVPFLYAGTIKPAPVNTREVVDNFDDNIPTGWTRNGSGTYFPLLETNQQFTVRGHWPGLVTPAVLDTLVWDNLDKNWSVANNRTLDGRVDLVRMSENATNAAAFVFWSDSASGAYILMKGRDFVQVGKWVGGRLAVFFHEQAVIKNTNVVLSLALMRLDPNVVLTARVLDKDNQEAVLYQRSVVDTPQADPTLTTAQLLALSGMNLSVATDMSGPPITSGTMIFLDAFQYTGGTQPELDVTYDNLELRTSEIPPVGIERAVRLSWPALGTINYAVQGAPTVQGPWLPIPDQAIPGMNQMTVPASDPMRFFRLIQAP